MAAVGEVRITSEMGVNYTKLQNIRLDKKWPLALQFTPTQLRKCAFSIITIVFYKVRL